MKLHIRNFCLLVLLTIAVVMVPAFTFAQQKPAAAVTTPIPAETQQKIRQAFQNENTARLAYETAQAQRQAIVSEAKAQAKCWPCELAAGAKDEIVFASVAASPTPSPK